MADRYPSGHNLYDVAKRAGLPMPEDCRAVILRADTDDRMLLHFEVIVTAAKLATIAEMLRLLAEDCIDPVHEVE